MRVSLQVRTALFCLACGLIPLLLAGVAAVSRIEVQLVDDFLDDHRQLISQVRSSIEEVFDWYGQQLETLGHQLGVQSMEGTPARQAMSAFLAFHPGFRDVALFTAQGRAVATVGRGVGQATTGIAELPDRVRTSIRKALAGARIHAVQARGPAEAYVYVIAPVPSLVQGRPPVGVLTASVALHGPEIRDLVDGLRFVGGSYLYLTDHNGEVVAMAGKQPGQHVREIRVRPRDGRSGPTSPEQGIAGLAEVHGRPDLIATAPIPDLDLVAVVGRPYEEVNRCLDELLTAVSFYLIMGVLLALVLGLTLARGLARPILQLVEGIRRVARGELAHRLPVDRADELGQAASAFNELATHLQRGRLVEELWTVRRDRSGDGRP